MYRVHARCQLVEIRRSRRMGLLALILMAMFGFLSLGQSRADATCGDYLSHQDQHRAVAGEQAIFSGGSNSEGLVLQSRRTTEPGPCRGPFCKQGPMQSPLSTPIVSVDPQDRWIWTAEILVQMTAETSFLTHFRERVELPLIVSRLERPPKSRFAESGLK